MLSAIAIVPAAPLLVPELMGAAAAEMAPLRDAALAAAAELPARWVSVGTGAADATFGPDQCGTFAGYGADVPVTLGPVTNITPVELPLSALVAGWLRGRVAPQAVVDARVYAAATPAGDAVEIGRGLRTEIDATAEPVGVLVVADGAHTLSPSAPGGYRPESVAAQQALDEALASGDASALASLPDVSVGRVAHEVLVGLAGAAPRTARELYRGAPYGVGYFVGVWLP